jgi:hypothetical protein
VFNSHFATFAVFDFKSQGQRELNVPDIAPAPTLLAEKALADGGARIAYAVPGKCDASDADYFNDPESVCFIYSSAEIDPHEPGLDTRAVSG